jgi:hypothetical protein
VDDGGGFDPNKRVSYACAEDPSGWMTTKYLRMPFTINRKPGRGDPVVHVLWDRGPRYKRVTLAEELGPWATLSNEAMFKLRKKYEGGSRSEHRAVIINQLVWDGLSDEEIFDRVWNTPWVNDTEDKLEKEINRLRYERPQRKGASSKGVAKRVKPQYFDLYDLKNEKLKPKRWIIPGVMPEGLGILGGRPKKGKSWLTLDWVYAVATGEKAFGQIECNQGDVLWLPLEDSKKRLKKRMKKYLQGRPLA